MIDDVLLDRMRRVMHEQRVLFTEKKMFGGNCFMVDDKMCFGTYKGGLMVRVAPEETSELLSRQYTDQMIHGDREMKGYLFVNPLGYDEDSDLEFWIKKCLEFNPRATSSKKKK